MTTHGYKNHALRSEGWRFIRYEDGAEELYDTTNDPYERTNRANVPSLAELQSELGRWLPTQDRANVETPYPNKRKVKK